MIDTDEMETALPVPTDELLSVRLPRERIERLRNMALTDARAFRKNADGAAKHGPKTRRNATWVAECAANASAESAIVALCDAALSAQEEAIAIVPDKS